MVVIAPKFFNPLIIKVCSEMSAVRASWNWLKTAWATQPVLVVACAMGMLGKLNAGCVHQMFRLIVFLAAPIHVKGPILVLVGPGTRKGEAERLNWPTHYRSKPYGEAYCVM